MDTGGFSQGDLRKHNELRILDYVREHPGQTQVEIAKEVDLTRAAVSKLIGPAVPGQPPAGLRAVLDIQKGRPAKISLRTGSSCALAADIGVHHVRARCADLAGRSVAEEEIEAPTSLADDSQRALELAASLIERVLEQAKAKLEERSGKTLPDVPLAGLSIGVPFPVDADGVVIGNDEWRYVQLPSDLWLRLGWSTHAAVVLDAHLGAIAELDAALAPGAGLKGLNRNTIVMAYLKWSSSLTGAIISGGVLQTGFRGMAGSFGHDHLLGKQPVGLPPCSRCGRICVNAKASLKGIIAQLGVSPDDLGEDAESRARALVQRARDDSAVAEVLADAARTVGNALGTAINTINPRLVIVGGAFHPTDYTDLSRYIHEGIEQTVIPQMRSSVLIQSGRRTGEAALAGGIAHALREFAAAHLLEKTASTEPPSQQPEGDA